MWEGVQLLFAQVWCISGDHWWVWCPTVCITAPLGPMPTTCITAISPQVYFHTQTSSMQTLNVLDQIYFAFTPNVPRIKLPQLSKCRIRGCPSWWEDNFHKRTNLYGEEMRISQRESEMDFPTEGREDFRAAAGQISLDLHFNPTSLLCTTTNAAFLFS